MISIEGSLNMLGIKKQFIKNMIKLEVVSNTPGQLQIYIAQIKKIEDEYKAYEPYAQKAIKLLPGINTIDVDYEKGILTINYDPSQVTVQKVYSWLQVMIDVGIDYYDDIKAGWNKQGSEAEQVEKVWQKMQPVLLSQVSKIK